MDQNATPASLESILITDALAIRAPRQPDLQAEIEAFHALARQMASNPEGLLKALVLAAIRLCQAGSAGVSLLEQNSDGKEVFRWVALAGTYEGHEGGTTPRDFSPCGTCLDRNAPQLYSYPARRFTYFQPVVPPIVEGLVLPFGTEMAVLGTIWVVSHDESRHFDREDVRVMTALADFTAAALRLSTTAEANAKLCRSLQDADHRKDVFLATLAHELRNPLAPIRNAIEVLRAKGPLMPDLQWARGVIDRQVHQMTHLIDDLLDVSRIALNKLALHRERLLLETVVQGAVEMSRPLIEQHGHALSVSIPPEPIVLDADLTRLAQVFSNLLNNAAKYSEPGGHIQLSVVREGSDAVVSVRDDGIGIPAEKLPHIFEMYAQIETEMERSEGGLGIGLALVKQLVAMHGGSVYAKSDGHGMGSEFVVRLPIDVAAHCGQMGGVKDGERRAASGLRILVVDDNQDAATSLGMLLRVTGNDPTMAFDGQEALALAGEVRPDVVLLDIGLPKLNGYEVARRIRQEEWGRRMVLIALTGWGQEEDRQRSRDAGFDSHMVKPVEIAALMTVLADVQLAGT